MANPSIFAAFERMWQHVLAKFDEFGNKTVSVDVPQSFTESQKAQARANIGITSTGSGDGGNSGDAVIPLVGTTDELTPDDVLEAIELGRNVMLTHNGTIYTSFYISADYAVYSYHIQPSQNRMFVDRLEGLLELSGELKAGSWSVTETQVQTSSSISGVLEVSKGGTGQSSIKDTTYTTPRYRASALVSAETSPTTNGVINWIYE